MRKNKLLSWAIYSCGICNRVCIREWKSCSPHRWSDMPCSHIEYDQRKLTENAYNEKHLIKKCISKLGSEYFTRKLAEDKKYYMTLDE